MCRQKKLAVNGGRERNKPVAKLTLRPLFGPHLHPRDNIIFRPIYKALGARERPGNRCNATEYEGRCKDTDENYEQRPEHAKGSVAMTRLKITKQIVPNKKKTRRRRTKMPAVSADLDVEETIATLITRSLITGSLITRLVLDTVGTCVTARASRRAHDLIS